MVALTTAVSASPAATKAKVAIPGYYALPSASNLHLTASWLTFSQCVQVIAVFYNPCSIRRPLLSMA